MRPNFFALSTSIQMISSFTVINIPPKRAKEYHHRNNVVSVNAFLLIGPSTNLCEYSLLSSRNYVRRTKNNFFT